MKVLFVCSGNSEFGISPIVKAQGESLKNNGVDVDYFTIKGKSIKGYLKNIKPLRKVLKKNNYDIVHSHYSLSSYVVSLAGVKNQVISLMGSDVNSGIIAKLIIKIFNFIFWKKCIVKSEDMKNKTNIKDSLIIPNGVDFEKFKEIDKKIAKEKINFNLQKKHIIFVANPDRYEKNFQLAKKAFDLLDDKSVKLNVVYDVPHEMIPYYYYAADVLLMTSLWEGSPNVIKEAMACNCPIVSTDVGDVRWVVNEVKGCYITSFDAQDMADKIKLALEFAEEKGKTRGRERIRKLKLDAESVAEKLIDIYKSVIK